APRAASSRSRGPSPRPSRRPRRPRPERQGPGPPFPCSRARRRRHGEETGAMPQPFSPWAKPIGSLARISLRSIEEEDTLRKLVVLIAMGAVAALAAAALSFGAGNKTVWTAALSSGQEVPKQVVKDTAAHGQ